jgi:hypothetical protein
MIRAMPEPSAAGAPAAPAATEPTRLPEAVFVVGVSRSGTTLLRRVLESTSVVAIAGENHFVGHLLDRESARRYFHRLGDFRDDATIRRIVEFLWSGEFQRRSRLREISPFWRWVVKNLDRADMERRLLAAERTDRGMFAAFLRAYADHVGKQVIGEKTPAHINHADTLLEWFPNARIVHMVRDPRGVYVSELRRRTGKPASFPYRQLIHVPPLFALFILLQVTWAWAAAAGRHRDLVARYPSHYRMVRFEELVREPEATLAGLFDFLGLDMEPAVLRQKVVSYGVNLGSEGFDASAADRWQASISGKANRWLRVMLRGPMQVLGYRG